MTTQLVSLPLAMCMSLVVAKSCRICSPPIPRCWREVCAWHPTPLKRCNLSTGEILLLMDTSGHSRHDDWKIVAAVGRCGKKHIQLDGLRIRARRSRLKVGSSMVASRQLGECNCRSIQGFQKQHSVQLDLGPKPWCIPRAAQKSPTRQTSTTLRHIP